MEEQVPAPPQPHRISTSCERHPDESFTGFCPSCLFERLSVLDQTAASSASATTAGRKSASSAIKSLFRGSAAANGTGPAERQTFRTRPGSFLPELRRTKSFSAGKNDGAALAVTGIFEPQRKSCDVRVRSTLSSLINHDHAKRPVLPNSSSEAAASSSRFVPGIGAEQVDAKFNNSDGFVIDLKQEEESKQEAAVEEVGGEEEERGVGVEKIEGERANCGEIEEIEEPPMASINPNLCSEEQLVAKLEGEKMDLKPMKYHMDLDSNNKKPGSKDLKDLAGSFWSAASGFSKKLRSWTKKNNKLKKHSGGRTVQVSKKSNAARSCRETQSEIADYGYGRRSCDTDPRFSIDAGRMSLDYGRMSLDYGRMSVDAARFSVDDPRYSFDEPRASWDGYLIGGARPPPTVTRMNPMLSVVEDPAPARQPPVMVAREDNQIPLEEPRRSVHDEECIPGGALQTKDYYLDSSSSSRRRKSLDRSSSVRKSDAVLADLEEMKSVPCNAKVMPASVDYLHSASTKCIFGLAGGDRESLRDTNPSSLRDSFSESFDMGFRDSGSVIGSNGDSKGEKKSRSWRSWNIWGLIVRRGSNKDEDDDRYSRVNGVERSYSESWQNLGRDGYGGNPRGGAFNRNILRSNSNVSWRSSGGSMRKNSAETNGHSKKKSNEFVLERNRSARYSPSHTENGLLRFYLTPLRGSRRGATAKTKPVEYSHTNARSMLRLY